MNKGQNMEITGDVIEERLVPDPMMSDAEYLYRRRQEQERAEKLNRLPNLNVGKVNATTNATTLFGALAFIRARNPEISAFQVGRRYPHHEQAAARFKASYEGLYGSASMAVDPSREPVDTSSRAHDSGMASRIDRFAHLQVAKEQLGNDAFDALIDMLIFCTPCSAYADTMPSGQKNQRQIAAMEAERLRILDRLAILWGFRVRAA